MVVQGRERERVEERHNWALHLELNAVCLISCDNRNPTTLPCPSKAAKAKKWTRITVPPILANTQKNPVLFLHDFHLLSDLVKCCWLFTGNSTWIVFDLH